MPMIDFTVHFQRGSRVGARSLRMEQVDAIDTKQAIAKARLAFPEFKAQGYRLTRVDHFDEDTGRMVIDY